MKSGESTGPANLPAGNGFGVNCAICKPLRIPAGKVDLELKRQEDTLPVYTVEHIERPAAN